jgi:hypothetical protein
MTYHHDIMVRTAAQLPKQGITNLSLGEVGIADP